jgi:ketosteroid isomerase-like protein
MKLTKFKLCSSIIVISSVMTLMSALHATAPHAAEQAEEITRARMIETLVTALNKGDVDAATALFDGTAVIRLSDGRIFTGNDQIRSLWQISAEKIPAKVEIQNLLVSGDNVRFMAKVKIGDKEVTSQIDAVIRLGKIYLYTITNEPRAMSATMSPKQASLIGAVQSVREDRIYRETAERQSAANEIKGTIGRSGGSRLSEPIQMNYPSLVVPMYEIVVKLEDGSTISVTQAEMFKTGDRVRVVSIADKTRLLPATASETIPSDTLRSSGAQLLPAEMRLPDGQL